MGHAPNLSMILLYECTLHYGPFQGKKGTIRVPDPQLKKERFPIPNSKGTRNRSLERVPISGTDPTLLINTTVLDIRGHRSDTKRGESDLLVLKLYDTVGIIYLQVPRVLFKCMCFCIGTRIWIITKSPSETDVENFPPKYLKFFFTFPLLIFQKCTYVFFSISVLLSA